MLVLMIIVVFLSCANNRIVEEVKYQPVKGKVAFCLRVPIGFRLQKIEGSHELEQQYWYPDSSVLYVTNDRTVSVINYDRVYGLGDVYYARQFECDTMTVSGVNRGLHWKDRKYGEVTIDYAHVSEEKTKLFDSALESIQRCK